jgi:formylglycine-generating enzyme required for sulfatase activity
MRFSRSIAILGILIEALLVISDPVANAAADGNSTQQGFFQDKPKYNMVYVSTGKVEMGTSSEVLRELCEEVEPSTAEGCFAAFSRGDVLNTFERTVPGFWIDTYEVNQMEYASCVEAQFCQPIKLSRSEDVGIHKPQVEITWYEAIRYCNYRKARLPSEEEWEYAASGSQNFVYPWGNSLEKDFLPAMNNTRDVGTMIGDKSWIRAYDMAGNVSEWTDNAFLPYLYPPRDWSEFSDVDRAIRGGSWGDGGLFATTFYRSSSYPSYKSYLLGFRCARSADPTIDQ